MTLLLAKAFGAILLGAMIGHEFARVVKIIEAMWEKGGRLHGPKAQNR